MRLATGHFFGTANRQIETDGVSISARQYEPFHEQPWHSHERPTLFVHLVGDQLDETTTGEWSMPNLSVTYHPTSLRHRSRLGPGGARGVNIELSDAWLHRSGIGPTDLGEARTIDSEAARSAALRLIRIYAPVGVANPQVSDIILELVETITDLEAPADTAWLTRVEEQLAADFRKSIGLAGLAKSVGVHPVHLARMFRRRHGHSVTEHIQRLRVHDAVKQILAGDSIGSAALDAGFADQFHFTRTLKAHFGYCPMLVKRLRCFNRS